MTKDPPSVPALVALLKACSKHGDLERGRRIHSSLLATPLGCRLASSNAYVRSSLVSMYAKCGALSEARQLVLDPQISPHHHVVVSWNALITGYAQHGHGEEALRCYEQMKEEGIPPTAVTYVSTLKACGSIGAKEKGEEIHDEVTKARLLDANVLVGNALLDMYAKCGDLTKARQIFRGLCIRDVVSWNTMISGYVQCGYSEEALRCYRQMRREQVPPNTVTFLCTLKACGTIGAATKGEKLHAKILRHGLLKRNSLLGTALVDMYAKCGLLAKAQKVLEELPDRDVVSWNVLIAGYALQGKAHEALECLNCMLTEGISPDEGTFLCVLSACGRNGLVNDAEMLFGDMSLKYGIVPSIEHHICMVLVFGCGGHFDKAMSVIKIMQSLDYPTVWLALLGACRRWGNVKLGKLAFDQVIQLDDSHSAAYVLIAGLFTDSGMEADAKNIESMRWKYAALKHEQGNATWIDPVDDFHDFLYWG